MDWVDSSAENGFPGDGWTCHQTVLQVSNQTMIYLPRILIRWLAVACLAGTALWPGRAAEEPRHQPIKIMSFNLRYGTANDGANRWALRQSLVLDTIRNFDPDLLGLQEVLAFQADFLRTNLPGYEFHGAGRGDGDRKGEFAPIFFKAGRFTLRTAGHFWLSETPDVPGSKSWDSSLPRLVSWAVLADRSNDQPLVYGNTHFDHRGAKARVESARLIREKAAAANLPLILSGDFNDHETGDPYAILANAKGDLPWIDAYRAIHPRKSPTEGSFHDFTGRREGSRIDWIFHSGEFTPLNAMIDYTQELGRFPSDHFPVEAVLRLK